MNAFVLTFEENAGAYFAALFVRAMARAVLVTLWLILRAVGKLLALRVPVGLALSVAGAVALCAVCPWLPTGLAIVALYGWATLPRCKTQPYAVSWNSSKA